MKLIGVDAVGHRYPGNRCPGLIAGFYCALLEFEAVSPSCAHIVSAKKLADTSKRPPSKLLRSKTSKTDGHGRTVTFLQGYMEYARAISAGELSFANTLLSRMTVLRETSTSALMKRADDGFYHSVGEYLHALGHKIKVTEEGDAFALDYAIEHPETGLFALGIECDAPRHPLLGFARAREVWRTKVLNRAIPVIHRVSSQDWYQDPEQERRRLLDAVLRAITMESAT